MLIPLKRVLAVAFSAALTVFCVTLILPYEAWAQSTGVVGKDSFTAPRVQAVDPLGIDIGMDLYVRNDTLLTIGDPSAGGLAWTFHGHQRSPNFYADYSGEVDLTTYDDNSQLIIVQIGESVTKFSTGYVNVSGTGSTLSYSGGAYYFTDESGVVYAFNSSNMLSSIQKPDGAVLTINFGNASCIGAPTAVCFYETSVVSNRGYAFKFDYTNSRVYAVNMAAHNCDAQAQSCDGYDGYITIGSTTDASGKTWATVTDQLGNVWQYFVKNTYKVGKVTDGTYDRRPPGIWNFKDPKGYFVNITRASNGCITSFADPRGTFTFNWNWALMTYTVTDPSGNTLYSASINGDGICATSGSYAAWVKDGLGQQTTYNVTQTQGMAGTTSAAFDTTYNRLSSLTKPEGNAVSYTYDNRGNVTQITETPKPGSGLSATNTYASFDANCTNYKTCNKPNWTQDARGNKTYYGYDSTHGGVTSITLPADSNGITPKTVTTFAQFTAQIRNSSGVMINAGTIWLPQISSTCVTAVVCDGTVNQIKTVTNYSTYNLLSSSVTTVAGDNSASATTSYAYDNQGNVTVVDGPRSDVDDASYTTYDVLHRPLYEISVDPDGTGPLRRTVVHHVYSGLFETQIETGTGNSTNGSDFLRAYYSTVSYDSMGHKTLTASYIDGNATAQSLSQFNYDVRGRLNCSAARMNPSIYGTISGTDACSLGATGTYGPDRITKNIYNNADQLTEVDQAYGVTGTQRPYGRYTYTNNGLKQTETDANGNKTMFVYDGFGRLSQVQFPSTTIGSGSINAADYEQYGYDANGNRISWRRRDGQTIAYAYDNLNRLTWKDLPGTTTNDVYSGYDLLGHIKYDRFGSAAGVGTSYNYDGLGRLISVTDVNGRTVWYSYNQASARTQLTLPDMNNIGFGLDNANRLSTVGWNANSGLLTQSYDNLGRLAGQGKAGGSTSYGYDNLGRLTSMTNDLAGTSYDVTWSFTYNPGGQLYTSTATSMVYDYKEVTNSSDGPTYDGLNRDARLVGATSACPSGGYDARQSLICDGLTNRSYTYDVENRLLTAGGSGSGGAIALSYDPEGRLSSYTAAGTTTTFLYDGVNLIAEYNGSSITPLRRYIHGTGTENPLLWLEGASNSAIRYFYTDYHGSVIAYTDSAGNLAQLYKYGPYGEPKDINNADSWSGSRFRYTGQTMLYEARLYYYKARVYDPKWGRFLQTDPIGNKDDLDLYSYTAGDPVNRLDPTGMYSPVDEFTCFAGCRGAGVAITENYVADWVDCSDIMPIVFAIDKAMAGKGSSTNSANFLLVGYNGFFHDEVVRQLAKEFRDRGDLAETEVPVSMADGSMSTRVDLMVEHASDPVWAIEVKTGLDPTFTPAQMVIYPHMFAGAGVVGTDRKITTFGFSIGELLPPIPISFLYVKNRGAQPEPYEYEGGPINRNGPVGPGGNWK